MFYRNRASKQFFSILLYVLKAKYVLRALLELLYVIIILLQSVQSIKYVVILAKL
jgi:hypothetical protein